MRLTKIADASEGQNEKNKVKTEMAGYETENEGYSE